jgi:hypothetical protein
MTLSVTGTRFRVVSGPHGWGWVLTDDGRGDVLARSAAHHPTVRACRHGIELVQTAPLSHLHVLAVDGGWCWELRDDAARVLARSVASFRDRAVCRSEMMRFRRSAVRAAAP